MKLKKMTIDGFKAQNRLALVDFSDQNVTVIYGDNGCGKTTFLKTINSFLSQNDTSLSSMGISSISAEVEDGGNITKVKVNKSENGYDWTEFEKSPLKQSSSLSLGVERGISTQTFKIEPEILLEFFDHPRRMSEYFGSHASHSVQRRKIHELADELSFFLRRRTLIRTRNRKPELDLKKSHLYFQSIKMENIEELLMNRYRLARFVATRRIQSALFDTLSIAIDIENLSKSEDNTIDKNLSYRLIENKERIIEALDDGEENNFKTRIVNILKSFSNEEELNKIIEHSLLRQLFRNMLDELEVEKSLLSSINLLLERFNAYLIENKKLVINNSEIFVEIDGGKHSINELSSGERHILTFLSLVLFEGNERNFLIIDEPEISLNIKWQRELLSIFSELLPTTQIIVASHSPALAKRNPDFLCELKVWRS